MIFGAIAFLLYAACVAGCCSLRASRSCSNRRSDACVVCRLRRFLVHGEIAAMIVHARLAAIKGIKPHEWIFRFVFGGAVCVSQA